MMQPVDPGTKMNYRTHGMSLMTLFALWWAVLAIKPHFRHDWMLENVLLFPVFAVLIWGWRHRLFSRLSHTLIFVFLCLHELGAHYTYEKVPYDDWWQSLTGHSLNAALGWTRNNFDRCVHFLYGLLCAYPFREMFLRVARVRGFWTYFFPLDVMMSTSALFELIEWAAAELFGGDLGAAYLGTQGDVWDAHKDMALATLGALIAMIVTGAVNKSCNRDFAREWSESLRVVEGERD